MTPRDKRLAFAAVSSGSFLATFTGSSVAVAVPTIGREFGLSPVELQYIVSAYVMLYASLMVPFGRIADLYGRSRLFQMGFVLFCFAQLICALAPSGVVVIIGRGVAGVASAMYFSNAIAILSSVYGPAERGRVLGANLAIAYAGLTLGPFIGGMLTGAWGWRSVFFSVLPLGLLGLALAHAKLPRDLPAAVDRHVNLAGSGHYVAMLMLITLGVSALPAGKGIIATALGIALAILFFRRDRQTNNPLIDVGRFRGNRVFLFAILANFLQYFSAFATIFLLSLFLQHSQAKGLSPHAAGLVLLTQPLIQALFSPVAGALSDRVAAGRIALTGMLLTAASLLGLAWLSPATPLSLIVLLLMCQGIGFAFFTSPNNNVIMGSVPREIYGIASGILGTAIVLGMSMSLSTTAVVFNLLGARGDHPEAFLVSVRAIFAFFFLLSVAGALITSRRGRT